MRMATQADCDRIVIQTMTEVLHRFGDELEQFKRPVGPCPCPTVARGHEGKEHFVNVVGEQTSMMWECDALAAFATTPHSAICIMLLFAFCLADPRRSKARVGIRVCKVLGSLSVRRVGISLQSRSRFSLSVLVERSHLSISSDCCRRRLCCCVVVL